MKVGAGGASAEADVAEYIAAVDVLAGGDTEAGQVSVAGGDSVAVIHRYGAAIASEEICKRYGAIGGGQDRRDYRGGGGHPRGGRGLPPDLVECARASG